MGLKSTKENQQNYEDEYEYVDTAYDYIDNGAGELMLVIDKPEGECDEDLAIFTYNGADKAILYRNGKQIVRIYVVPDAVKKMLKEVNKILVTEMAGKECADVYEADIEYNTDESLYR